MGAKPLADGRTGADSTCNHDSPPIFETVTWKERETFRRGNLIENSHFKIDVGEVKTRYGGKEEEGIQTSKKMLLPDPESGSLHCCSVLFGQPFNGSHLACNNSILCHILHVLLIYQNRIDDEHRWFQQRISNLWSNTSYFNTLLLLYSLFLTVCHHQARIR
ncbi:Protein of unknown function [Gryllus bimaculatus]|nr:Protein of unknown function [Gryllus bimaculatus]